MTSVKIKSPHPLRQPHRSRYEIANKIMAFVSSTQPINRRHKTGIGHSTGLTHKQTVRFLQGLVDEGLLVLTDSRPDPYYEITPQGRRCLQVFAETEDDFCPVATAKHATAVSDRIT